MADTAAVDPAAARHAAASDVVDAVFPGLRGRPVRPRRSPAFRLTLKSAGALIFRGFWCWPVLAEQGCFRFSCVPDVYRRRSFRSQVTRLSTASADPARAAANEPAGCRMLATPGREQESGNRLLWRRATPDMSRLRRGCCLTVVHQLSPDPRVLRLSDIRPDMPN